MGDKGAHFISYYLSTAPLLRTINLSRCQISDIGVELITRSLVESGNPPLQTLNLEGNLIGRRGLELIIKYFKQSKFTRKLILTNNPVIVDEANLIKKILRESNLTIDF